VRFRATLLATVAVGLALVLGGVLLVVATRASQTASIRTMAETRAEDIAVLVREAALPTMLPGRAEALEAQVVSENGEILSSTADVADEGPLSAVRLKSGETLVIETADGNTGDEADPGEAERMLLHGLGAVGPDGQVTIFVAASLAPVEESAAALVPVVLAVFAVLLPLVAGIAWVLTGRALAPVEAIRSQAESIGAHALDLRVPVPAARDEIGRLAVTMNEMLDRLDFSARAQRRFVADASHELRSPIAAMRTMLEVAREHPESVDRATLLEDLLREDMRLERLATDLLTLARYDERALTLKRAAVDVCALVAEEGTAARTRSAVEVHVLDEGSHVVQGDRDRLVQALRNLLENAVRHAASAVWLSCAAEDSAVVVTVSDNGPGVPIEKREAIFGRFVRLDDSRGRASGGTGLGLAVCRAVVEAHGGTVECVDPEHGGATFRVRLPLWGVATAATLPSGGPRV
jgi:signal transduction histidine kinase